MGSIPKKKKVAKKREVGDFLEKNPLAKIVILIDTHSLDDGSLVCGESGGYTYSDTLGQVCAPSSSYPLLNSLEPPRFSNNICQMI